MRCIELTEMDCRKLTYWNKAEVKVLTNGKTEKNACSHYALTNHLGNVLSVVTDRRTGVCGADTSASGDTLVAFYNADIISAQDYYPFGMQQPGRKFISSSSGYRFGFNGKEQDDQLYGDANAYNFGARIYDARLGRWMSVDIKASKHPGYSPYMAFADNPILYVDPDGKENIIYLVVLPSANSALDKVDYAQVVAKANEMLKAMGLNTRVKLYEGTDFDPSYIDATDSYAILGSTTGVKDFISEGSGFGSLRNSVSSGWSGAGNNPEKSAQGALASLDFLGMEFLAPGIAISSSGIKEFSKSLGIPIEEVLALTILHGGSHNAGVSLKRHIQGPNINMSAGNMLNFLTGESSTSEGILYGPQQPGNIEEIYAPQNNETNIGAYKANFGTAPAQDNYARNKEAAQSRMKVRQKSRPPLVPNCEP